MPLSFENDNKPVPPLAVTVIVPFVPPLQVASVLEVIEILRGGLTIALPVISSEKQLFGSKIVKVKGIDVPEAAVLKLTLIGFVKVAFVTLVIPVPEIEYFAGGRAPVV
jgi:hypothetical protein